MSDAEFLERYVRSGCGEAFAELVRRHVDLVYSVAIRRVGDRHLAEDVVQAVFLILSQKARAGRVDTGVVLAGWLFHTTRFVAANAVKREARRRKREAALMRAGTTNAGDDPAAVDWDRQIAPVLDRALAGLGAGERDALLLRYLEERKLPEVAATMGVSVDAARKRIERGLVKLRRLLGAAGVTAPSVAGLAVLLGEKAAVAAPLGLAGTVAGAVTSGAAGVGAVSLAQSAVAAVAWAKAKLVASVAAMVILGMATTVVASGQLNGAPRTPVAQVVPQPVGQVAAPVQPQAAPDTAQIEGLVKAPDETPAAGAEVFVVMPVDPAYAAAMREISARLAAGERIPPEQRPKRKETRVEVYGAWPAETQTTDAQGRFTCGGAKEPYVVVVRHPSGYAEVGDEEFKKTGGQVWLKAYGRVEGVLFKGPQPQGGQNVVLFRSVRAGDWDVEQIRQDRSVMTDPQGKFVFENVCPDTELWLAWDKPGPGVTPLRQQYTPIEVGAGKTITQDVGGKGRPVIGRVSSVPANAPDDRLSWTGAHSKRVMAGYGHANYREQFFAAFKQPPGFEQMTRDEQKKYERAFFKTPEGRDLRKYTWGRAIDLQPDGSFRIDDVLPGKYSAYFRIFHDENGFGEDVVECRPELTVPEFPPGVTRVDEPLDLGTIPVTLKPRALVGTVAPDFEAKTLDHRPFKLSDHRGKYVFLKVWWNFHEMDVEVPAIKKAWETMQKERDWVLINVGFDKETETTKKRAADHQIPGIHCQFADWEKFPKGFMGSPSSIHIIGPDGKVLARNIQTIQAETAVGRVLLEK